MVGWAVGGVYVEFWGRSMNVRRHEGFIRRDICEYVKDLETSKLGRSACREKGRHMVRRAYLEKLGGGSHCWICTCIIPMHGVWRFEIPV